MLSKCANPACGAKFQYLRWGKLFVVNYRAGTRGKSAATDSEFVTIHDPLRYFWLCSACSQSMTIQASSAGGVRLANAPGTASPEESQIADDLPSQADVLISTADPMWGCNMVGVKMKLEALESELQFLDNGGYRRAMGWRAPLVFEDSPICPKKAPYAACPDSRCVLLDFLPSGWKREEVPCRHIPLNEVGETLHTLYNTASEEEIEQTLHEWLKGKIAELEEALQLKPDVLERKAG